MALYLNILFHFTSKHNLYSILNSTFKVSYARERILGGSKVKEFAVPMVSFSDLRLSEELKVNIGTYGKCGIGLTKDWAISKGLNPVMYASESSLFTEKFLTGVEDFFRLVNQVNDINGTFITAYNNTLNTLRYIKNYKGDLIRYGKSMAHYVFANEREWRYVPLQSNAFPAFVSIEEIQTSSQKSNFNKKVADIRLHFQPDDIQYLIVEKDQDINDLISHLRTAKNHFPKDTIDRLSSRILTYEQIENDI